MNIVHVPGFLSDGSPSHVTEMIAQLSQELGHKFYVYSWRSGNSLQEFSQAFGNTFRLDSNYWRLAINVLAGMAKSVNQSWSKRRRKAFEAGIVLSRLLMTLREPTILTGFSMGGYIINTALVSLTVGQKPSKLRKVIQLAPAADSSFRFPDVIGTIPTYCIHSKHDHVLEYLYQVAQKATSPAGAYGYRDSRVTNIESIHGHNDASSYDVPDIIRSLIS